MQRNLVKVVGRSFEHTEFTLSESAGLDHNIRHKLLVFVFSVSNAVVTESLLGVCVGSCPTWRSIFVTARLRAMKRKRL